MALSNETLWFAEALLPDGWAQDVRLSLSEGRVVAIATGAKPEGERHAVALPGMPNLHSHAFQRAMAGLTEQRGPEPDSFWTWRTLMYRYLERLTPDDVEAIASLAYMEMLEGGFTRVGEFHYLHHDRDGRSYADPAEMAGRIVNAAQGTGIGLTLLPVFYAHAGFGGLAPTDGQKRFITGLDSYADVWHGARRHAERLPDAVMGAAPHSLRAVTPEELDAVAMMSDGPVHIHIAEQQKEVADCVAWSGARPVAWLLDHAEVDDTWCFVHATHMTEAETAALARSGAVAGLCPITEANLGDGVFPGAFLAQGGRFGVGSDSNVLIDAAQELRLLEYSQRLFLKSRNIVTDLYSRAVTGGAQALGVAAGLTVGAAADIVSLDADHPALIGRMGQARLDAHVFAATRPAIDCVWRHGAKVVESGRHIRREAILAAWRKVADRLA